MHYEKSYDWYRTFDTVTLLVMYFQGLKTLILIRHYTRKHSKLFCYFPYLRSLTDFVDMWITQPIGQVPALSQQERYRKFLHRRIFTADFEQLFDNWGIMKLIMKTIIHFKTVKSTRVRRFTGPYFSAFGLNTERYGVSIRIQSECGKIRTRKTPNTETFHTLQMKDYFQNFVREVFCKKLFLKSFAEFTGKTLCWIPGFSCNFIKKRLQHRCSPVNFAEFLTAPILKNICEYQNWSSIYFCTNMSASKCCFINKYIYFSKRLHFWFMLRINRFFLRLTSVWFSREKENLTL